MAKYLVRTVDLHVHAIEAKSVLLLDGELSFSNDREPVAAFAAGQWVSMVRLDPPAPDARQAPEHG